MQRRLRRIAAARIGDALHAAGPIYVPPPCTQVLAVALSLTTAVNQDLTNSHRTCHFVAVILCSGGKLGNSRRINNVVVEFTMFS